LPGWPAPALAPSLRAFQTGCRRPALARICDAALAIETGDEAAARHFFETNFVAYALISSDTGDSGVITGYYEPVINGSRKQSAVHRFPIFGVPDDLITVDLAATNPELRSLRLRGRLDGRRLVPYYSRAEIDARGFAAPAIA
jgi:membrane-bound lytic murein transglycosylase A